MASSQGHTPKQTQHQHLRPKPAEPFLVQKTQSAITLKLNRKNKKTSNNDSTHFKSHPTQPRNKQRTKTRTSKQYRHQRTLAGLISGGRQTCWQTISGATWINSYAFQLWMPENPTPTQNPTPPLIKPSRVSSHRSSAVRWAETKIQKTHKNEARQNNMNQNEYAAPSPRIAGKAPTCPGGVQFETRPGVQKTPPMTLRERVGEHQFHGLNWQTHGINISGLPTTWHTSHSCWAPSWASSHAKFMCYPRARASTHSTIHITTKHAKKHENMR